MPQTISRRQFLRADFRAARTSLRPPWALQEDAFVDQCTRCGDCLRACPAAILRADGAGFPEVDFTRGACTFCAACAEACNSKALSRALPPSQDSLLPWQAKAEINDRCLTRRGVFCEVCRDQCAARAIVFRPAVGRVPAPQITPQACTGCGACVGVCPAGALRVTRSAERDAIPCLLINTLEVSCT